MILQLHPIWIEVSQIEHYFPSKVEFYNNQDHTGGWENKISTKKQVGDNSAAVLVETKYLQCSVLTLSHGHHWHQCHQWPEQCGNIGHLPRPGIMTNLDFIITFIAAQSINCVN